MKEYIIKNGQIINAEHSEMSDVWIKDGKILKIGKDLKSNTAEIINAQGKWLLPGVIDDQVHFREPGLTHKATIETEARAAVAGGVTSFMEMPNTVPQATTIEELEKKYETAQNTSLANYSFYMGATNNNVEEIEKVDPKKICGVKIFMGSSTGNMLVDDEQALSQIFEKSPTIIALHCEDEETIRQNTAKAIEEFGENIPFDQHPIIRNAEACYLSSSKAVELAKKYDARIHILHISTEEEIKLFTSEKDFTNKKITSEVCVHHLNFNANQYKELGSKIKCNPAIKSSRDQEALWKALNDDLFDVIATDHAPHTIEEKNNDYLKAPSGLPLIQHTLLLMLEHARNGKTTRSTVINRMCHKPAELFNIDKRGFIKEGYWADIVIVNPDKTTMVSDHNVHYKCGWSPLSGTTFNHSIESTFVSGHLAFNQGKFDETTHGKRLNFNR